jgi:hypothetical protein
MMIPGFAVRQLDALMVGSFDWRSNIDWRLFSGGGRPSP